jgi:hypothetical protein
LGEGIRFKGPADILSVHARKHQIQDDETRTFFFCFFQSCGAIQYRADGKTSLLEMVSKKVNNILLILDN